MEFKLSKTKRAYIRINDRIYLYKDNVNGGCIATKWHQDIINSSKINVTDDQILVYTKYKQTQIKWTFSYDYNDYNPFQYKPTSATYWVDKKYEKYRNAKNDYFANDEW